MRKAVISCSLAVLVCLTARGDAPPSRAELVDEMIAFAQESRLLDNVRFTVPVDVWKGYLREMGQELPLAEPSPVAMIASEGRYHLAVKGADPTRLTATVTFHVFKPAECRNLPALSAELAWEKVTVNGEAAELAIVDGWLRFTPAEPGPYVISAEADLPKQFELDLPVLATLRTAVVFDSDEAWEVSAMGEARKLVGSAEKGTHGRLALIARSRLTLAIARPRAEYERPARYQLSGDVVWNLDAGTQQVTAALRVGILGGSSDRIDLVLPPSADRVTIRGPDVRDVQVSGGQAAVFLRGRTREQTRLDVSFEMPVPSGESRSFDGLAVRDGHWAGGTLVVSNAAGGEVLAGTAAGLRELVLSEIPESAAAMVPAAPALAYAITSRQWRCGVEVLDLGEYALRETIADIAHYEISLRSDGSMMCRATYEIRNRAQQFLRLDLPRGSQVLVLRVNEKSQPLAPAPGKDDVYLVPLVRSMASVKGLVSFPVEVVFLCRTPPVDRRGDVALPLPRVDMPIAYAWCEAYVPRELEADRWTGPMARVDRYSSETATASLTYGAGELAEGYAETSRPMVDAQSEEEARRAAEKPEPKKPSVGDIPILGSLFGMQRKAPPRPEKPVAEASEEMDVAEHAVTGPEAPPVPSAPTQSAPAPSGQPEVAVAGERVVPVRTVTPSAAKAETTRARDQLPGEQPQAVTDLEPVVAESAAAFQPELERKAALASQLTLARNYFRAGRDFYEKGDFTNAVKNFEQAQKLAPESVEATNAARLMSNIDLAQGKLAAASRSEKAAAAQVASEIRASNVAVIEEQRKLLKEGEEALQAGQSGAARAKLQAAQALGQELVAKGVDVREQQRQMARTGEQLAELEHGRAQQLGEFQKKAAELKAAGKYEEALKTLQAGTDAGGFVYDAKAQKEELKELAYQAEFQRIEKDKAARQEKVAATVDNVHLYNNVKGYSTGVQIPGPQAAPVPEKIGRYNEIAFGPAKRIRAPSAAPADRRGEAWGGTAAGTFATEAPAVPGVPPPPRPDDVAAAVEPGVEGIRRTTFAPYSGPARAVTPLEDRLSRSLVPPPPPSGEPVTRAEGGGEVGRVHGGLATDEAMPESLRARLHRIGVVEHDMLSTEQLRQAFGTPADDMIQLELPDPVPVEELLKYTSNQLGVKFVWAEDALASAGSIRLTAHGRVSRDELYHIVDAALQLKGLAMIRSGDWIRILPADRTMMFGTLAAPGPQEVAGTAPARAVPDVAADQPKPVDVVGVAGRGGGGQVGGLAGAGYGRGERPLLLRDADRLTVEQQRVVAKVREAMNQARSAAEAAEQTADYNDALDQIRYATRLIDQSNVLTPERAGDLREEVLALHSAVDEARKRAVSETEGRRTDQISRRLEARRPVDREARDRQAGVLWQRSQELARSGEYQGAAETLDQLLVLQPGNDLAQKHRDDYRYLADLDKRLTVRGTRAMTRAERVTVEGEESAVPSHEIYRYPTPEQWAELTAKRRRLVAGPTGESEVVAATRRKLATKGMVRGEDWSISLQLTATGLGSVLDFIAEAARARPREIRIVIDYKGIQEAGISLDDPIDLQVRDVSIEQALKMVIGDLLGYVILEDGTVLVSSRKALNADLPVVAYQVGDLVRKRPDLGDKVPRMNLGEVLKGGGTTTDGRFGYWSWTTGDETTSGGDQLRELIERTVQTDEPWQAKNGRASVDVDEDRGIVFVRQTAEGQRQVETLLASLAAEQQAVARGRTGSQYRFETQTFTGVGVLGDGQAVTGQPVTRVYDVRSVVGSKEEVAKLEKMLSDAVDTDGDTLVKAIRDTNSLIVTAPPADQEQVRKTLQRLEAAQGPQVEVETTILTQHAKEVVDSFANDVTTDFAFDMVLTDDLGFTAADRSRSAVAQDPEFQRFVDRNYDWAYGASRGERVGGAAAETVLTDELARKLALNLSQKVQVNSINLNVDARSANSLGVNFTAGNNGVIFATIDEAQFRTLAEMASRVPASRAGVPENAHYQETIVGTDALVANRMVANVKFAGERGNTIDVYDNPLSLEHEQYMLIDNGKYLTAIRADKMQNWREAPSSIPFAVVPQTIDVPRVGRRLKFEKTLVEPTDELVIRAEYVWKGDLP